MKRGGDKRTQSNPRRDPGDASHQTRKILLTPGTKEPSSPKQMEHKELQEILKESTAFFNDQELAVLQDGVSVLVQQGHGCDDPQLVQPCAELQEQAKKVQQLNKRLNNHQQGCGMESTEQKTPKRKDSVTSSLFTAPVPPANTTSTPPTTRTNAGSCPQPTSNKVDAKKLKMGGLVGGNCRKEA